MSLGTPDNPLPSWALHRADHTAAACATVGKPVDAFYDEFLPAFAAVVQRVEHVLRSCGREDTKEFAARNILRIRDGQIVLRVFTCVNGLCHVPAESILARGVGEMWKLGWRNLQYDFEWEE